MNINKIILVGRTTNDPQIKSFDNGGKIANFGFATDDSYKDKQGNKVEQTDFHNISIRFEGLVNVVEKYVNKGDLLYLEGKSKTRSYEKDGEKKYITEVVVNNLTMLGGKKQGDDQSEMEPAASMTGNDDEDTGLPF